jgi:hypothetical protein
LKISSGTISQSPVAWIGDQRAFSIYQEYYNSIRYKKEDNQVDINVVVLPDGINSPDRETYSKMIDSMKYTINSQKVDSVGGFTIPVLTHKNRIEFGSYLQVYRCPIEISELLPNTNISFGNEATGSFSVNFCQSQNFGCAAYIHQARFGINFSQNQSLLLEPFLIKSLDEVEFFDKIGSTPSILKS